MLGFVIYYPFRRLHRFDTTLHRLPMATDQEIIVEEWFARASKLVRWAMRRNVNYRVVWDTKLGVNTKRTTK